MAEGEGSKGARQEAGEADLVDDRTVVHLIVPWSEAPAVDPREAHVGKVTPDSKFLLALLDMQGKRHLFTVPVVRGAAQIDEGGRVIAWGMVQLAPTVYTLFPSWVVPGVLHAFVTIVQAPEEISSLQEGS